MPRRILIVGGVNIPEILEAVERCECRAVVLAMPSLAGGRPPAAAIDEVERVDFRDQAGMVRKILQLHERWRFSGLLAVVDFVMVPVAVAAARLRLPGCSLRTVRDTVEKFRMRHALERAGLGQVRHALCRSRQEAEAFFAEAGGPIIVKPAMGTGSEGVSRVDRAGELAPAVALAAAALGNGAVLCEEFLDGPEVSLEACTVNGRFIPIALTDKHTNERFLEVGHDQPSCHPEPVRRAVEELAERALAALGVEHGVTHSEFRLTGRGPVLVETHTRKGGGSIHLLTRITTGVDLSELTVRAALGESPDVRPLATGESAVVRFLVGPPGRIAAIGMPAAEPGDGIAGAGLWVKPGDEVLPRSSSNDRLGYVVASGPTPEVARRRAECFLARVRVEYESVPEPFAEEETPCHAAS